MSIIVRTDDLSSPQVQALVAQHLVGMHGNTPAGHVHALAVEGLRAPEVTFWSAWLDGQLCGCGAMKTLSANAGEIKSMRTRAAFLRKGVGQAVLDEIVRTARARGYVHLYLETGTGEPFAAAHALYLRNGFVSCGPFGDYEATAFNVFMVKSLAADRSAAKRHVTSSRRVCNGESSE
jgi:putative acetyltransferase